MKIVVTILVFCVILIVSHCTPQKNVVEYTIPDNYEGQVKQNLIKMLDEGQQLYRIHCSNCHGIFTKGKDSIPNFSRTQVENYRTAVLIDDPTNHSVAQRIRIEDLDRILMFLQFRKKSGNEITLPRKPVSN